MSAVSDVKALLDDAGVFWIDAHVFDALNQSLLDVWTDVRHDITTATLTFTASQASIALSTNIMIPQRITREGFEWYPTTYMHLQRDNAHWRDTGVGTPRWFVQFDAETLVPYPRPDATIEFVLWGIRYPSIEVTSTSTDFTVQVPIKNGIVYRAAALLAQNTRPALGASWNAISEEWLARARMLLRQQFKHQMPVLRPGNVWTLAHQGALRDGRKIGGLE